MKDIPTSINLYMDREVIHEEFWLYLECIVNIKLLYLIEPNKLGVAWPVELKVCEFSFWFHRVFPLLYWSKQLFPE